VSENNPQTGWYPDPADPARLRFWDGANWTDQTRTPESQPEQPLIAPGYADTGSSQFRLKDTVPTSQDNPYSGTPQQVPPTYPGDQPYQSAPQYPGYGNGGAYQPYYPTMVQGPTTKDGVPLAGWWWRVLSVVLDSFVTGIVGVILTLTVFSSTIDKMTASLLNLMQKVQANPQMSTTQVSNELTVAIDAVMGDFVVMSLVMAGVALVYATVMLIVAGGTIGQLICGMRVVPTDEGRRTKYGLKPGQALVRAFGYSVVSGGLSSSIQFVPILGFLWPILGLVNLLWPLWDPKRQCLHDKLARTQVVRISS
jgi:uncharacterized RDD family membrane protein YckC